MVWSCGPQSESGLARSPSTRVAKDAGAPLKNAALKAAGAEITLKELRSVPKDANPPQSWEVVYQIKDPKGKVIGHAEFFDGSGRKLTTNGSPDSDKMTRLEEKPQHKARITKPFYQGKYLVTQEQWEAVMGNNPSHFKGPAGQLGRLPEVSEQAQREVCRWGRQVPVAHRSAVGICLPSREQDAVLLWG